MKITKMSLVAALLVSSSAFALENTKVSGDSKLFYSTTSKEMDKSSSTGQAALDLSVTADLVDGVSVGATTTALSTLGLENNLVSSVWAGQSTQTQWWVSEAWMASTLGKTTVKIGRQQLDTPFAFTETWNIAYNTFDSAVVLNSDIPDTTLVAAWVGKHNGNASGTITSPVDANGAQTDSFTTFVNKGAYAFAVVNNSFKPLTVQAWYYDVVSAADAMWLQADLDASTLGVSGLSFGVQYASIAVKGILDAGDDSSAIATKVGYTTGDLSVSFAYSATDEKGTLSIANVATGGASSKLYTEAWWNCGYIAKNDTTAFNLTAEYSMKDMADFGLYVTQTDSGNANRDLSEIALTATKSYGPLDTTLALISSTADDMDNGDRVNTAQAYLTLNF